LKFVDDGVEILFGQPSSMSSQPCAVTDARSF
jgi:hypothetical protein